MCSLCKAFIPNGELGLVHSPQLWGKQMLGGAEKDIQSISCSETSRAVHMGSYPLLPHNQLLPQFLGSFLKGNKCFGSHNSLLAATINPKGKSCVMGSWEAPRRPGATPEIRPLFYSCGEVSTWLTLTLLSLKGSCHCLKLSTRQQYGQIISAIYYYYNFLRSSLATWPRWLETYYIVQAGIKLMILQPHAQELTLFLACIIPKNSIC